MKQIGAGRIAAGAALLIAAAVAVILSLRGMPASSDRLAADDTLVITGGPFEPSGVAHVPGSNYVLFVDDGRDREIFLMELAGDGKQVGDVVAIPLGAEVRDMEGITTDGRYFYVVGSQSKLTGHRGDGLVRFTFDLATRRIDNVERFQGLKAWLAGNVAELAGTANGFGDDILNIEGLAWDATNQRLLLGLRAPLAGGHALIVPVRLRDSAAALSRENLQSDGQSMRVDLGGAGIRGLEYDSSTRSFQIISGAPANAEVRDFQVFGWGGGSMEPLRHITTFSRLLKPEGFTRASIGGRATGIFVFDVGRFVMRD